MSSELVIKQACVEDWLEQFRDVGTFLEAMRDNKFNPESENFDVTLQVSCTVLQLIKPIGVFELGLNPWQTMRRTQDEGTGERQAQNGAKPISDF